MEGDFKQVVKDEWEQTMLQDAYNTISALGLWDWLKDPSIPGEKGFMFLHSPEIDSICKHMAYQGHSGSSFAWTMRTMEYIAKNGWGGYLKLLQNE